MTDPAIQVLHVTPSLSRSGGGVTEAVWGMVRATANGASQPPIKHSAAAIRDQWTATDEANVPEHCDLQLFRQLKPRAVFFSPALGKYLNEVVPRYDIVHAHCIRSWTSFAAGRAATRAQRPRLISMHGTLHPATLGRNRLRKAFTHTFFENTTLRTAACLHATSSQEAEFIRRFGCRNPIATIPLGIGALTDTQLSPAEEARSLETKWPTLAGKRRLLFLGLLAPWKGLLRLAAAWSAVEKQFPDWQLAIAGPDVGDFGRQLRDEVSRRNLNERVTFLGAAYGADKTLLLRHSDLLVLPSDLENFGFAVGEALAAGLPVIASRTAPWEILERNDCGWWIEPSIAALESTLQIALAQSRDSLSQRGARGREVVVNRFTWSAVGQELEQVYQWLAGRGSQPACVSTR
jgi:glycosyltransferase involved in cell wall biosynthesis